MVKTRILVADDEPSIRKYLRANLEDQGYEVLAAVDGSEALKIFETELPDLMILDIMMPGMDGFDVCHRIREWSQVPIIMLSARGSVDDKAKCLDLGADDYVTKPFGARELVARVRAVLRRIDPGQAASLQPAFSSGELTVNFAARRVTVDGSEVKLTPTEYNLLQELVLNLDKVLTHGHLLSRVWGPEYQDEKEYLRVYVGRIRAKIESDPANPSHIVSVPGVGYMFAAA